MCRTRPAFTFLEVVAALSIIMLVLGVLLPVFMRGKDAARRTHCSSNLQQLATALHLYAQDYDGRFPHMDHQWGPVLSYTKNRHVFVCTSEPLGERERWRSGVEVTGKGGNTLQAFSSYQYRGGLANDDAASTPIARDWEAWHMGYNLVHLGGNVTWVRDIRPQPLTSTPRPVPDPSVPAPPKVEGVPEDPE